MLESVETNRQMNFEWNAAKAHSNLEIHGITFAEAMTVFRDPLELTIPDPGHSEGESRFLSLGRSDRSRLLVVS